MPAQCVRWGNSEESKPTMVAFKYLGVIATARPRHRQVRDLPHGRFQIALVVPIALIKMNLA